MNDLELASVRTDLDKHAAHISTHPTADNVWALVESLAQYREAHLPAEWKEICELLRTHTLIAMLTQDPYTRDARSKPSGYAGDARTLDYVYLREHPAQDLTRLGQQLFTVTTGVPIADAVRDRSALIADAIARSAKSAAAPLSIGSVACGHLRELDHLPSEALQRVAVLGIDQDSLSVAHCQARFERMNVTTLVGSVRDLLTGRQRIPPCDMLYASGLFDYLEDRAAALLIKRMLLSVKPGGCLLVPNLTPSNPEIAYMEAVMDWWMIYRNCDDLVRLVETAPTTDAAMDVESFVSTRGRVAWLRVTRQS